MSCRLFAGSLNQAHTDIKKHFVSFVFLSGQIHCRAAYCTKSWPGPQATALICSTQASPALVKQR